MEGSVRKLLLLSSDPDWLSSAHQALDGAGGGALVVAGSARESLRMLVNPAHDFTHLLLEPDAADGLMSDLLGVTAGEFGSQVELVLLGNSHGLSPGQGIPTAMSPADLSTILTQGSAPRPAYPKLSTTDIAVSFSPKDIECRFQPIVRLQDRVPVGMEILVRLRHKERGTIGPDLFIPQIERAGLSLRLTEAVANCAMTSVDPALLQQRRLFLSLNIPLDVLLSADAMGRIDTLRRSRGIPTEHLLIELTESKPVSDLAGLEAALHAWRNAGYRIAIDDMGPEMMNQRELFDMPFNVVKLDKQIVLRSETDAIARSYLQRTVDSARTRSLSVIAEGIENAAMWTHMRDIGVEHAQGFLIARALPASALPAWLDAWSAQLALPRDR